MYNLIETPHKDDVCFFNIIRWKQGENKTRQNKTKILHKLFPIPPPPLVWLSVSFHLYIYTVFIQFTYTHPYINQYGIHNIYISSF